MRQVFWNGAAFGVVAILLAIAADNLIRPGKGRRRR